MAEDFGGKTIPFKASEDMSTHQYRFVVQKNDTEVELMNAATDIPIGVLQNAPEEGETAMVRIDGTSKLAMNAAVAVETLLKAEYVDTSDNGKGDAADTEGDIVRGLCIQASGAEDDVGTILLCLHEMSVPA